jgi:arginase
MSVGSGSTLRLNFPLWQGGNLPEYHFGAQLLAWLAPAAHGPVETVSIPEPEAGAKLSLENGIAGRSAVLRHLREARQAIEKHGPARILTLGGDCLVDLPPIAYLNALHRGKLGVLWVDAHPDVTTPKDYPNAHAHVLGALLGRGDPDLTGEVETPLAPSRVMYAGLDSWSPVEHEVIQALGLRRAGASALAETSSPVLDWISDQRVEHLAVHFDLDVLDPTAFRPLLFNQPRLPPEFSGVPRGRMLPDQVTRLLADVARACDVVGLAITEHLPWDTLALRDMLRRLPLMKSSTGSRRHSGGVKPSEHTVDRGRRVHRRCARLCGLSNDLVVRQKR